MTLAMVLYYTSAPQGCILRAEDCLDKSQPPMRDALEI